MEKEYTMPQEIPRDRGEFPEESREIGKQERAMQEIGALFHNTLHPEVMRQLTGCRFDLIHQRFSLLIESGEATRQDEKAYIEARCGWREDFPFDEWDAKLFHVILPADVTH